jgi:hypothetical protein
MSFETTVDFVLNERAALEGTAGQVEVRGVEFASSFVKGGVFGSADPELRSQISARLECATLAATKQKLDIVIEFLDGDGELIDRIKDGANLKNESKVLEMKNTTLKWVVPHIKQAKISVRAKG